MGAVMVGRLLHESRLSRKPVCFLSSGGAAFRLPAIVRYASNFLGDGFTEFFDWHDSWRLEA